MKRNILDYSIANARVVRPNAFTSSLFASILARIIEISTILPESPTQEQPNYLKTPKYHANIMKISTNEESGCFIGFYQEIK